MRTPLPLAALALLAVPALAAPTPRGDWEVVPVPMDLAFVTFRNPEVLAHARGFWHGVSRRYGSLLVGRDLSQPFCERPVAPVARARRAAWPRRSREPVAGSDSGAGGAGGARERRSGSRVRARRVETRGRASAPCRRSS